MKLPTVFFILSFLIGSAHCQPAGEAIGTLSTEEAKRLSTFRQLPAENRLSPAPKNEPGKPLLVCVTLLQETSHKPLVNTAVTVYHTDVNGDYQPRVRGLSETARLSGKVQTDEAGRFFLSTILPGKYDNKGEGGHIHLLVEGAQPKAYTFNFLQYSSAMDRRFINGNDQYFLLELKRDGEGNLIGFLDIEANKR